jgi:hypothetical protein
MGNLAGSTKTKLLMAQGTEKIGSVVDGTSGHLLTLRGRGSTFNFSSTANVHSPASIVSSFAQNSTAPQFDALLLYFSSRTSPIMGRR